jgi:hypothetical protein
MGSCNGEAKEKQKPLTLLEASALAGQPVFTVAAGVIGSYLHSGPQWVAFGVCVLCAVACIVYLVKQRLQ